MNMSKIPPPDVDKIMKAIELINLQGDPTGAVAFAETLYYVALHSTYIQLTEKGKKILISPIRSMLGKLFCSTIKIIQ